MDSWKRERTWSLRMESTSASFSMESVPSKKRYEKIQEILRQDTRSSEILSYIFLSRAPLTFGHSQLVTRVRSITKPHEADLFEMVSPMIKGAISVFESVLGSRRFQENSDFKKLAKLTRTHKRYLKILVLRASAEEKPEWEYKIHLVPYFESHAEQCQERYRGIHHLDSDTGGLLGWLGERETEVDRWQIPSEIPWAVKLDEIANVDLNMKRFAEILTEAWPSIKLYNESFHPITYTATGPGRTSRMKE
jgi:hypothetical protein